MLMQRKTFDANACLPLHQKERKTHVPIFMLQRKKKMSRMQCDAVTKRPGDHFDAGKRTDYLESAGADGDCAGVDQERVAMSHKRRMTLVVPEPLASSETNFLATNNLLLLSLSSR